MVTIKKVHLVFLLLTFNQSLFAQGISNYWLFGGNNISPPITTSKRSKIDFYTGNAVLTPDSFNMKFSETEGNISDASGNLLMSSNGIWIADASGDTMQNGSNLNPSVFTNGFKSIGLTIPDANVFIPYPGDTSKFVLFHMTGNWDTLPSTELYYSIVNLSLNNGLGAVILKNQQIIKAHLSTGIGACKHANGRDWWIIAVKDSSNIIYKILLTPQGVSAATAQVFPSLITYRYSNLQPKFSPDGRKFAFATKDFSTQASQTTVRLFNFDRCTGILSNQRNIAIPDTNPGAGTAFAPSSKYLYYATFKVLYQINSDTSNVQASLDSIAGYDNFSSGGNPYLFWLLYLANDGKIYIPGNPNTTSSFINYPDSAGIACDMNQHTLNFPSYILGTVPNHPNYYLGPVENSGCDTLSGIKNIFSNLLPSIKLSPNPSTDGVFAISYMLEQNKKGVFQLFDSNGRLVYEKELPPWSTFQQIEVPKLNNGIYSAKLRSGKSLLSSKLIIQKEGK